MRVLLVNRRDDRIYISSLVENLMLRGVSIGRDGIFIFFEVEDITKFLRVAWEVYVDLSRDGRGVYVEQRRFFKVNDYPDTFWYELRKEDNTFVGLQYGRL